MGPSRFGLPVSITNSKTSHGLCLPPLVIKVAAGRRSGDLAREAWFYEEMEGLQGVSIARCYGFFQADLDEGCEIVNWAEDGFEDGNDIEDDGMEDDSEDMADDDEADDIEDEDDDIEDDDDIENDDGIENNSVSSEDDNSSEGENILCSDAGPLHRETHPFISVLVLERLGEHIPVGVSVESIQPDVYEIYNDIGRLGIQHGDARWRNVVQAPVTPESLVCPYHGHPHQWRIIDFDRAKKSNLLPSNLDWDHQSYWEAIFDELPRGNIVDWDVYD